MFRLQFYTVTILLLIHFHPEVKAQVSPDEYSRVALKMGSRFEIIAVAADSISAQKAISAGFDEIDRIEQLISSWIPESETSRINAAAGSEPVKVSKELYDLIYRSLKVSQLTNGAYDISFAGMGSVWEFSRQEIKDFPDSQLVASAVKNVDYRSIILNPDESTVLLALPDMKIGFGSIGKGYAANKAMKVMKDLGISSGMVNAGGDLITWGQDKESKAWSMGIADPNNGENILAWLSLQDMALVTSGDYQKYFTYKGRRYGHILDPRTGYPAVGVKSVSILCPDAELADALATAIYVLGEYDGMALMNRLVGVEGLIITDDDRILESENLILNYYTVTD